MFTLLAKEIPVGDPERLFPAFTPPGARAGELPRFPVDTVLHPILLSL